jgi:hypothetical protein
MTVRMVLVEGVKADGVTVDHDVFDIAVGDDGAKSSTDQVIDAILGTRESAAEGGHHLTSVGVAWTDHNAAAQLREELVLHKLDDVVLVSELHAAGSLAQAVGRAVGYDRTALMFIERTSVTLSVVDTATGAVVRVQNHELDATNSLTELADLVADLENLDEPPQGLFVVGSGVDIAGVRAKLAAATSLPVHAPEEAELALARGAALASSAVPRYEASTVGLAYAQDPEGIAGPSEVPVANPAGVPADATQMAAGLTQLAEAGYMAPLGYSAVADAELDQPDLQYDEPDVENPAEPPLEEAGRKPFLLVGSALASVFVIGVVALVISLSVSIRPTVDQRPAPGAGVIAPTSAAPAPVAPQAQVPEPAPAPPAETIEQPRPVVQEVPRTVYVSPAPQAPAPVVAAPAPEATPGDPPAAPPPAPAPVPAAPPPAAPPVIVIPAPIPLPILQPPSRGTGNWPFPVAPTRQSPQPTQQESQPTQQEPQPTQQEPQPTQQQPQPTQQQPQPTQQQPQPTQQQAPATQAPTYGSGGDDSGGSGSRTGSGDSRSGTGSSRGSGGSSSSDSGSSSSGGSRQSPLWPLWPGGSN